jgi:hypothetical protein
VQVSIVPAKNARVSQAKPFVDPGLAACRLTFSAIGDQLAIVNTTDVDGTMSTVSLCSREDWEDSQMQLVGHESTVVCAAYSPRVFCSKEDPAVAVVRPFATAWPVFYISFFPLLHASCFHASPSGNPCISPSHGRIEVEPSWLRRIHRRLGRTRFMLPA